MPTAQVIPELGYENVAEAAQWLCDAFSFTVRLRIGDNHRVQLAVGTGAVVVRRGSRPVDGDDTHSVMVRVADVDAHHARAVAAGAPTNGAPQTHVYGERQYTARDIGGHSWTFSQSIDDVDPRTWGGEPGDVEP